MQPEICARNLYKNLGLEAARGIIERVGYELRPAREWGDAAAPIKEILATCFTGPFDRCLRVINEKGCELEQASLDAIITTDRNGIVTSANQGSSNLLGLDPDKVTGRPVSEILAGGADEARRIMQRLETESHVRNHLTEVIAKDGRRVPIRSPLRRFGTARATSLEQLESHVISPSSVDWRMSWQPGTDSWLTYSRTRRMQSSPWI